MKRSPSIEEWKEKEAELDLWKRRFASLERDTEETGLYVRPWLIFHENE